MRRGLFARGSLPQPPRGWRGETDRETGRDIRKPGRRQPLLSRCRYGALTFAALILAALPGSGFAQHVLQGGVAQSAPPPDEFATGRANPDEGRTEITPKTSGPGGYRCLPPDPAWQLVAERGDGSCEWLAPYPAPSRRGSARPAQGNIARSGGDAMPLAPRGADTDSLPRPQNGPVIVRQLRGTAVDIYRGSTPYPSPPELRAMYDVLKNPMLGLLVQCAASYVSAIDNIRRYAGRFFQHDIALGDGCSRRFGVPLTPSTSAAAPLTRSADRDPRPADAQTICTGVDLAKLVFDRYGTGLPISIAKVAGKQTFVVFLAGTEFNIHQKNNVIIDGFEAGDIGSEYDSAVLHALSLAVPPGSELIFVGHSLGGMVAQNLTRRFAKAGSLNGALKVTHIISFGSPKTGPDVPGVIYRRFVIPFDPVPRLTAPANYAAAGLTYVDSGEFKPHVPLVGEHLMYPGSRALKLFDAYGQLSGHDCMTLESNVQSFPAR